MWTYQPGLTERLKALPIFRPIWDKHAVRVQVLPKRVLQRFYDRRPYCNLLEPWVPRRELEGENGIRGRDGEDGLWTDCCGHSYVGTNRWFLSVSRLPWLYASKQSLVPRRPGMAGHRGGTPGGCNQSTRSHHPEENSRRSWQRSR